MYCPRCSQQHVSEDISFCTRCGFPLGVVKELLVTDGAAVAGHEPVVRTDHFLRSKKGLRRGVKLIFFSLILLPVFFALSYTFDSPIPLWIPALTFLAGLTFALYSRIFGEDIIPSKHKAGPSSSEGIKSFIPPPASVKPIEELGAARVNTAEIIHPPSITEHTTNLLRKTEA